MNIDTIETVRTVNIIEVIAQTKGTAKNPPHRVAEYWSPQGTRIAVLDLGEIRDDGEK